MSFELMNFHSSITLAYAANEILKCNEFTAPYGLALTREQAIQLTETRHNSLNANGRMEFGGGIIEKLIKAFCDSPNLPTFQYAETMNDLVEIFYDYKNETMDYMSDDALIEEMRLLFDGICQGSLELLAGRELEALARNLRAGRDAHDGQAQDSPEDEEQTDEAD